MRLAILSRATRRRLLFLLSTVAGPAGNSPLSLRPRLGPLPPN
jgi:hypothetical protein